MRIRKVEFQKIHKKIRHHREKNTNNFLLYYFVFFPQQNCVYTCYVAACERRMKKIETFEKNWLNVSWIIFSPVREKRKGNILQANTSTMRRTVEDQSTIGYKRNEFIAIIKSINIFFPASKRVSRGSSKKMTVNFFFGIFRSAFKNGGLCLGLMHQPENFYH